MPQLPPPPCSLGASPPPPCDLAFGPPPLARALSNLANLSLTFACRAFLASSSSCHAQCKGNQPCRRLWSKKACPLFRVHGHWQIHSPHITSKNRRTHAHIARARTRVPLTLLSSSAQLLYIHIYVYKRVAIVHGPGFAWPLLHRLRSSFAARWRLPQQASPPG